MKGYFSSYIVFIDSDCIFCNFWGNYIIKNDRTKSIFISTPKSKVFEEAKIKHHFFPNPSETIILYANGKYYSKSEAVIKIAIQMKSWYSILAVGYLVPKFIRNKIYDLIASRRKSIMKNDCVISELRSREKFIT